MMGNMCLFEFRAQEVVLAYRELWRVERAFREIESGLELTLDREADTGAHKG